MGATDSDFKRIFSARLHVSFPAISTVSDLGQGLQPPGLPSAGALCARWPTLRDHPCPPSLHGSLAPVPHHLQEKSVEGKVHAPLCWQARTGESVERLRGRKR
jgi:hypothetical protein